jgi:hypothetical protein
MMRPVRLVRIAAEAEGVRLRGMATRIATRVVFAVIGLIFLLGVMVFAHVAAWVEIRAAADLSPLSTAGVLAGVDLVLAIILLFLASRSSPSRVEVEALEVRRKAIAGLSSAMSVTQMVIPVLRIVSGFRRRRTG